MMTGIERISAERKRQIEEEDFTAAHDDLENADELAIAAACYAMPPRKETFRRFINWYWPWNEEMWKPSPDNRIRELEKAGALIAAEIDRLLRLI
ncbi:MAG: hypothetical protein LBP37_04270 [Spirochaetaceae bacterium]|jgi:hypothetical protein|nr:hypothetical protein [Spirochaetaceae bacterium]